MAKQFWQKTLILEALPAEADADTIVWEQMQIEASANEPRTLTYRLNNETE